MVSKLLLQKWPQGPSMFLCPALVTGRTRSLGKVLFLDCQLQWMCHKKHPRFVSPSSILPYPYPLDTSEFLQHHSLEGAFTHKWGDPKEGAWSGNPNIRRHGALGALLLKPRRPTSFGRYRCSFTAGGPNWI